MPDDLQPQPVVVVEDTKAKGALGTNANTALQYGQFGILLTALTVGGPLVWNQIQAFHSTAVQTSASEHKAAREQFSKQLETILKDAKDQQKEAQDRHEKQSEKVWGRVGKLTDAIDANTKANAGLIVEQSKLVVELREERHFRERSPPAKAATKDGTP